MMYADQGLGYADQSFNGRNYNNGAAALAMAGRAAAHAAGAGGAAPVSAIVISGDIAYSDGYLAQWEDWLDMMSPAISRVPLLIANGNHDCDWMRGAQFDGPGGSTRTCDFWATNANPANSISSGGECGLAFKLLPCGGATPAAPWYSFAAGPVAVVVISSEHNVSAGSAQHAWLVAALAAVDRARTPWLITTTHRSAYVGSSAPDAGWASDAQVMAYLREALEPLFDAYAVSMHFSGHTHVTQRHCASRAGACVAAASASPVDGAAEYVLPPATVYYSLGNGGATSSGSAAAPFLLWRTPEFGYAVVTARSSTVLEIAIMDPLTGGVLDLSRIVQAPWPRGGGAGAAAAGALTAAAAATILALAVLALAGAAAGVVVTLRRRARAAAAAAAAAAQDPAAADCGGALDSDSDKQQLRAIELV
jgi:hypothetical protein